MQRRAEAISLLGLAVQVLLAGYMFFMWRRTDSTAAFVEMLYSAGGGIIWFALWMLSRQRRLVTLEGREVEQLRRERESAGVPDSSIFEVDEEQFNLARRRLRWMTRWLMPFFTLASAAALLGLAWLAVAWPLLPDLGADFWGQVHDADVGAAFVLGGAFVAFLVSRYAGGLAKIEAWQQLRAGASYLFGNALTMGLLAVCLGLAHFEMPAPERILAVVIRLLMLLLGLELLVNLVLDFYRPRLAGQIARPAFDSRFLALFSETASIARSIAEAINYQFGFEVSKTWFYKLLERSIVPLIYFGAFCLFGITSLVVVDTGELAVIERWGRPIQREPLGAGLALKYPWPIEQVYKFDVQHARRIVIGFSEEESLEQVPHTEKGVPLILWTGGGHGELEEADILVATPVTAEEESPVRPSDQRGRSVPVSIMRAVVAIEFRVRDIFDFGYRNKDSATLLEGLARRELVRYAASVDQERFLASGRRRAAELLKQRIQAAADSLRLGVELSWVGFLGVHPAQEVAEAYQAVVGAEQEREAKQQEAQQQRNERLAWAVGDAAFAEELAAAIESAGEISRAPGAEAQAVAQAERRRDELMARASGEVARVIAEAQAARTRKINEARGDVDQFRMQLVSYQAAPTYYAWTKYFETLKEGLARARRYVAAYRKEGRKLLLILNTEEEERLRFGQ